MHILPYYKLKEARRQGRIAAGIKERAVRAELMAKYGGKDYTHSSVMFRGIQLPVILSLLGEDLASKSFLDLSCGSVGSTSMTKTPYEPWLCRYLHHIGAKVIGVDINPTITDEDFPAHRVDLMQPGCLDFVDSNSVHLANAHALLDSPVLYNRHGETAHSRLLDNLVPQLERIVKPNGFFLYREKDLK